MSDPLPLLDAASRGMTLALLLLLAWTLARTRGPARPVPALRAGWLLALGLAVQVVASSPWVEYRLHAAWQAPLVGVSVGNAVLFWLFARALFDDAFALRPHHAAIWLATAGIAGVNCLLHVAGGEADVLAGAASAARIVQRLLPPLFALLALWAALQHWGDDLLESRRRLRAWVVASGVVYTLVHLGLRLASADGRLSAAAAGVDSLLTLAMVAVIAAQWLTLPASELFAPAPGRGAAAAVLAAPEPVPTPQPVPVAVVEKKASTTATGHEAGPAAPDPAEERLAAALDRAMREQRLYQREQLTIAGLAAELGAPEYRLRRLINQRLGHRNFNAYVNAWRLAETFDALADPGRRDRPVLTIALEAGFQSIGPFNRAFKAATGLTPTEFRQRKLAET